MPSYQTIFQKTSPLRRLGPAAFALASLLASSSNAADTPVPDVPAPREISVASDASKPTGTLSLQQAISLAVAFSPQLQASAWDADSSSARSRQARLWPNPELELERENFGGSGEFSGSENAEDTVSIAQALPLNGQIRNRRLLAEARYEQAAWDYHLARLQVILETTRRFVVAALAERRLELAAKELELANNIEEVTAKRVDAGDASPVELSRVIVPVVSAELTLANAELAKDAAMRRLALSWGASKADSLSLSASLDALRTLPNPDSLIERINQSPELARWTSEISAREAEHRLARSQAIPNPRLRFGLKKHNQTGDEGLVVGISLPLPVFDRNQGEKVATQSALRSAEMRQRALELQIEGTLNSLYFALAAARAEASALQQRAIPAAESAFEATRRAFAEGELPYLDVLDAQRTLFDVQNRYLDALAAYHTASIELEALLGGDVSETNN